MFGSPETTTGGRALKFYATIRIDIRRQEALKQGQEIIGNKTRVKVVKNKVAPPFKSADFDIMYGEGISKEGSIVDIGTEMEIILKSGAWYSYNGERLGQGRENVKEYLKQHPDMALKLEQLIRANMNSAAASPSTEDGSFDEE
jgi:recombination protein RecA